MTRTIPSKLSPIPDPSSLDLDGRRRAAEKLQSLMGSRLPGSYIDMLLEYGSNVSFEAGACYRPKNKTPWSREDGTQSVEVMYGLSGEWNLFDQLKMYAGRMPETVIPIGGAPGGNLIVMDIKSENVYFWDHEDERTITGNRKSDFGNMYLIASTFSEFISSLEPQDQTELTTDGIVDVWLHED